MANGVSCLRAYYGFGVVRDADAGSSHHLQVVGTIADGDYLLRTEPEFSPYAIQPVRLALRIQHISQHAAGQLAIDDFQDVGMCVIQPDALYQPLCKKSESAGD